MYKEAGKSPVITLNYYKPTNKDDRPFMPVEFAVAAYRFGHSLIRPFYVISDSGKVDIFGPTTASTSTAGVQSQPTWSSSGRTSFRSIRPFRPAHRARSTRSCRFRSAPSPGRRSLRRTRRKTWPSQHAARKARRSAVWQQVAKAMRVPVLSNATLGLNNDPGWGRRSAAVVLHPRRRPSFRRTTVNGSGRWAAGSWLKPSSDSCNGTRTLPYLDPA